MAEVKIHQLLNIQRRFLRSAQLERDFRDPTALQGYVVTKQTRLSFDRIAEEGRVAVRNERRQAIEALKKTKNDGGVSEDAIKTTEADVQKLTDSFIAKVDQHLAIKEKEIMTV